MGRRLSLSCKGLVRPVLGEPLYDVPGDSGLTPTLPRVDVEVTGPGGEERSSMAAFRL